MVTADRGEKIIRTVCQCVDGNYCGILAHVKDGVLVKVEPAEFPEPQYRHICAKGLCGPKWVYHSDRLKYPLKRVGERGEGKWQRISWDEAFETIAAKLMGIARIYSPRSVAWGFHSTGFTGSATLIYQRMASVWDSTLAIDIGPGDAASVCADKVSYGLVFWPRQYTMYNFQIPKLCVIWGQNSAVTAVPVYKRVRAAQEQGSRVVVVDPRFTPTVAKADEHIAIRPGTDAALALGMIDVIINQGLQDESFIINHTVGPLLVRSDNGLFLKRRDLQSAEVSDSYIVWDTKTNSPLDHDKPWLSPALRGSYTIEGITCKPAFELLVELAGQYPLQKTSAITEVAPEAISRIAIDYATRKPAASIRGQGNQRTFHGDLSHRAITALAAVTGNISMEGPGNFVFNQAPIIMPQGKSYKLLSLFDVFEAARTDEPYPIRALWLSGMNTANQYPNFNKTVNEYLPRMEFLVAVELFMTATAEYADIVLPGTSPFERTELATPFNHPYLQLQQKVIEPLYECKSELEIVTELAKKMGLGQYFDKSGEELIEILLSSEHHAMKGITLERLKQGPVRLSPYKSPACTTPSGRIEFYSEKMREFGEELPVYKEPMESARRPLAKKYPLSFLQVHPKFRSHSMLANIDWLSELDPEPMLDINPVDADKRGIKDGDMVVAFNDRGSVKVKARVHEGIKAGIVNIDEGWWPGHFLEGTLQALTHDVINPAQKAVFTPPNIAYDDVLVEVRKAEE